MINLYYHGGSANHGCEAIVRSTVKILDLPATLFSTAPDEEYKYCVDHVADIVEDCYIPVKRGTLTNLICALSHKLHHNDYRYVVCGHKKFFSHISENDICLSIGGDHYCYAGTDKLGYYNKMLHKKGAKTVLWGCSIEPSALTDSVVKDLKEYDLITVRESLSYEGLRQAGVKDNVLLFPDPAFQLDKCPCDLPDGFFEKATIGINASPLAADYGNLVMENYEELIRYILETTGYDILLIPHVVKEETDDRKILRKLLLKFEHTGRIAIAEDHNCMELKSIISQCRMFIGARTHAVIAAYSSCVPALAAGYSIKARGIAADLFGTDQHYVVPVQSFTDKNDLTDAYIWLSRNEAKIREHLKRIMPEYCAGSLRAGDAVKRLGGK